MIFCSISLLFLLAPALGPSATVQQPQVTFPLSLNTATSRPVSTPSTTYPSVSEQVALLRTFRTSYEAYVKAWCGLPKPADRTPLLDTSVIPNITYIDPRLTTTTRVQLEHLMTTPRKNTPNVHFTIDSYRAHHSQAMAEWTAVKNGKKFNYGH